jgi:hypothetical protein
MYSLEYIRLISDGVEKLRDFNRVMLHALDKRTSANDLVDIEEEVEKLKLSTPEGRAFLEATEKCRQYRESHKREFPNP